MAKADGSFMQIDDIHSVKLLDISGLVHAAYTVGLSKTNLNIRRI